MIVLHCIVLCRCSFNVYWSNKSFLNLNLSLLLNPFSAGAKNIGILLNRFSDFRLIFLKKTPFIQVIITIQGNNMLIHKAVVAEKTMVQVNSFLWHVLGIIIEIMKRKPVDLFCYGRFINEIISIKVFFVAGFTTQKKERHDKLNLSSIYINQSLPLLDEPIKRFYTQKHISRFVVVKKCPLYR